MGDEPRRELRPEEANNEARASEGQLQASADDVRPPRQQGVAGPNYRNLLAALGGLVLLLGLLLLINPFGGGRQAPARKAPEPPDSTFLDQPVYTPPEPQEDRSWLRDLMGVQGRPAEVEPIEDSAGEEWSAAPVREPRDRRQAALERALRSFTVRLADADAEEPANRPAAADLSDSGQRLLDSAASLLANPPGLAGPAWASPVVEPVEAEASGRALHLDPARAVPLATPGPRTLRAGTVIPARLETAINSDAPGPVRARVLRHITDNRTGRNVLIPAGSLLLGSTSNQLAIGRNRLLVAFEQLVLPEVSYRLPGLPGLATSGVHGLAGRVDHHTLSLFGRAALLATVGAGVQLAQPEDDGAGLSAREIVAGELGLEFGRTANQILARGLDRRPTVKVKAGHRFYIYLNRDIRF